MLAPVRSKWGRFTLKDVEKTSSSYKNLLEKAKKYDEKHCVEDPEDELRNYTTTW